MSLLSFENPVFCAYVIASALLVLKYLGQGWATVVAMIRTDSGLMNPEDLRKTLSNPNPGEHQLVAAESVDRSRRMQRNDTENLPPFFVIGFLFVFVEPNVLAAQIMLFGFVLARIGHAIAYATKRDHEVRALFFSIGSLLTLAMAVWVLVAGVQLALAARG